MIRLDGIYKEYEDTVVFDDFSLTINNRLTKLEGMNGSGKSTLFRILSGKESFKGSIYINGIKYNHKRLENNVILVDQEIILLENKTVLQNLKALGLNNKKKPELEFFNIDELINKRVNELSGGEKKRLSIYIALLLEPQILLLDEYSNYLDSRLLDSLNSYLIEYAKTHVLIYIDHNVSIGGEVISLDKEIVNARDISLDIPIKPGIRLSRYALLASFKPIKLISMLMAIVIFTCTIISGSLSYYNSRLAAYDFYKENNLSYFIYNKEMDANPSYGEYYYVRELPAKEIDRLRLKSITYYDSLSFSIKAEIASTLPKAYVFSYLDNPDRLGEVIEVDNKEYMIAGVIDYNNETTLGYQNELFDTVLIEGKAPSYNYISLKVANDAMLYKTIMNGCCKSDFISTDVEMELQRGTYKGLFITSIIILLVIIILTEVFNYKADKRELSFLRQYGYAKEDLLLEELGINILKLIPIGLISYFIGDFIIKKYQSLIIHSISKSAGILPNVFILGLVGLLAIMSLLGIFTYKLDINKRK